MVGASAIRRSLRTASCSKLLLAGYHVIPVNPRETEVLEQKPIVLRDIKETVDIVDVSGAGRTRRPLPTKRSRSAPKALASIRDLERGNRGPRAGRRPRLVMDACIGVTFAFCRYRARLKRRVLADVMDNRGIDGRGVRDGHLRPISANTSIFARGSAAASFATTRRSVSGERAPPKSNVGATMAAKSARVVRSAPIDLTSW